MLRKLKKGFTLVELAIVILVLSFLVAAVLVGKQLVVKAKVASMVNDINQIKSRWEEFLSIYGFVPGDYTADQCKKYPEFNGPFGGLYCDNKINNTSTSIFNGVALPKAVYYGGAYSVGTAQPVDNYIYGARGDGVIYSTHERFMAIITFSIFNGLDIGSGTSTTDIAYKYFNYFNTKPSTHAFNLMKEVSDVHKISASDAYYTFWGVPSASHTMKMSTIIGKADQVDAIGYNHIVLSAVDSDGYSMLPAFTVEEAMLLKAKLDVENADYPAKGTTVFAPYSTTATSFSSTESGGYCIKSGNLETGTSLLWSTSIAGGTNSDYKSRKECIAFIRLKALAN